MFLVKNGKQWKPILLWNFEKRPKTLSNVRKTINKTQYVEKNNILLVLEKKNILVGIKTLDITNDILKILNQETKTKNLINEN